MSRMRKAKQILKDVLMFKDGSMILREFSELIKSDAAKLLKKRGNTRKKLRAACLPKNPL